MDKIIKNILSKIESEGYEAYIVGGFVRDKILKRSSYDVDICTNALPIQLKQIFNISQSSNGYGGFNLKIKKYNVDITTYRKEIRYDKRKPVEIEYISNLFEDINRRDFTINSLCMDKNDNIIDLLNGTNDINDKIIKVIGNPDERFVEDPLRILRAIRFATILGFFIEKTTYLSICTNHMLVSSLSSERIKEELSKILSTPNYLRGLDILTKTGVAKTIGLNYKKVVYTDDLIGMWAQIDCRSINFSKTEIDSISRIKKIIARGSINDFDLFNDGLYLSLVAGQILGISRQKINKMYNKLAIKSMKDIDINGREVIELLNIKPSKIVSDIILDLRNQILNRELKNSKSEIKKYLLGKWQDDKRQ